jgi:hypothetical protein
MLTFVNNDLFWKTPSIIEERNSEKNDSQKLNLLFGLRTKIGE